MNEQNRLLRLVIVGVLVVAVAIGVGGIVLCYLGAVYEYEITFFEQKIKSTNPGIGALLISATVVVLLSRRAIEAIVEMYKQDSLSKADPPNRTGVHASGQLEVSEVLVVQNQEQSTCTVDFRVLNSGGTAVIVNSACFDLVARIPVMKVYKGAFEFSQTYNLDISNLGTDTQSVSCPLSQMIKPGEADRFGIVLSAPGLVNEQWKIHIWRLIPTLKTSVGDKKCPEIEISLPWRPLSFEDAMEDGKRYWQRERERRLNRNKVTREKIRRDQNIDRKEDTQE